MVDFKLFMRGQNLVCIQLPTLSDSAGGKLSGQALLREFIKRRLNARFI